MMIVVGLKILAAEAPRQKLLLVHGLPLLCQQRVEARRWTPLTVGAWSP